MKETSITALKEASQQTQTEGKKIKRFLIRIYTGDDVLSNFFCTFLDVPTFPLLPRSSFQSV